MEISNMKKTYKANKNHQFLKEYIVVDRQFEEWRFYTDNYSYPISRLFDPVSKPEWYDEVVEEPTVSEDEVNKVLNEIAEEQYDGTLMVDPDSLADYLARLEKSISNIKQL